MNIYYVCIMYVLRTKKINHRDREEKGVELQRQRQILDKDLGI